MESLSRNLSKSLPSKSEMIKIDEAVSWQKLAYIFFAQPLRKGFNCHSIFEFVRHQDVYKNPNGGRKVETKD